MKTAGKVHYVTNAKVVPSYTSGDFKLTKARTIDQLRVGKRSALSEKSSNITRIWTTCRSSCVSGQCKPRGAVGEVCGTHYVAVNCIVYEEVNRT